jgi:single-stranded DNA-binding protein
MMIAALVQGCHFRASEQRASKAGRQFDSATIRVKDGDGSQFVRVAAFSECAQSELIRLQDGDALSAQGPLKAETYTTGDGSTKISLSFVADHILALRQPPKCEPSRPKPAAAPDARPRQERLAGAWTAASGDPDDSIPF